MMSWRDRLSVAGWLIAIGLLGALAAIWRVLLPVVAL